jgi:WhiB family redox-sensing transcriptional regulator
MTDAYVPLTGPPTWHHAACRGEDPELWFPIGSESPTANRNGETAEDICQHCPYTGDLGECVNWAREVGVTAGIWGGLDMDNRKNRRPRPRCALDGCNNPIGRGQQKYCAEPCYREAELRANRERQRLRRQERRRTALLRP